ncbi:Coenzyme Q-binding protein COQ10 B, mitochondrial [Gaertneriomyces sp. JEL0708]|nr:Coenzyme Q-binding protein COQ10 B, mitochondrial [Gaertneriomyces sp. JEL0708]
MLAELGVGFKAFNERYTSEVTCVPYSTVKAVASNSQLFKILINEWHFLPHPDDPRMSLVNFHIDFEFKSIIYAQMSTAFFEQVSQAMVEAFERRAFQVYGLPAGASRLLMVDGKAVS